MDQPISYDEDFLAWSEQQAAALRGLAGRRGLPNELDLEHVAEEIEDLGRAEFNAVKSYIRQILAHLIKAASEPSAGATSHWRKEIVAFHSALLDAFTPSMQQKLDVDRLWRRALQEAAAALEDEGGTLASGFPRSCPFTLDDLLSETFDFREALARLRAALGETRS
jgi:Domain of unknown function DUF29